MVRPPLKARLAQRGRCIRLQLQEILCTYIMYTQGDRSKYHLKYFHNSFIAFFVYSDVTMERTLSQEEVHSLFESIFEEKLGLVSWTENEKK